MAIDSEERKERKLRYMAIMGRALFKKDREVDMIAAVFAFRDLMVGFIAGLPDEMRERLLADVLDDFTNDVDNDCQKGRGLRPTRIVDRRH